MQNEACAVLFRVLQSEINSTELVERTKNLITPEMLASLYKISKMHDLAHLVADVLDKNGLLDDSEVSKKFRAERNLAVYRHEQMQYELDEFCNILEVEKMEFIPLKGSVIRKYYPQPWMRTSCDIDILVQQDQVKGVVDILTKKFGYTYAIQTQHDYSLYSSGGVHIELHFILIFHDKIGDDFTKRVWESAVSEEGYLYKKKMPDDMFFTYHIAHMAQHVLECGGCGIKPFIDTLIIQDKMGISLEQSKEALERCGLYTFAQKVVQLSKYWFCGGETDETLQEFEKYVLNGGVYGTLDNKISVGASRKKGRLGYILKRLFVPYRSLCLLYPSLKKCPILFPFYQVRRWFRLLKRNGVKVSGAMQELKGVSEVDKETRVRMDKMLQDLGLQ